MSEKSGKLIIDSKKMEKMVKNGDVSDFSNYD